MRQLDLRMVAKAGAARQRHLDAAEGELQRVVDHLRELQEAGELVHGRLKLASQLSGIPRSTLYRRLAGE